MFLVVIPLAAGAVSIPDPLGEKTFTEILSAVTDLIVVIGLSVGVIMVIWSGILYTTAGGSEEKVTKARKTLIWTVVGIAILLSAKFIVDLIEKTLKGAGT